MGSVINDELAADVVEEGDSDEEGTNTIAAQDFTDITEVSELPCHAVILLVLGSVSL